MMSFVRVLLMVFMLTDLVTLQAQSLQILKPDNLAPSFSLPTLQGERSSLRFWCGDTLLKPHVNKYRHIVIVSFWATYCKPCQKEIPELMKFAEKHSNDSVKIIGINIDKEGAAVVDPFVKEHQYTIEMLLDPYKRTAERYGVHQLPALFVIDQQGVIRYSSVGFDEKIDLDQKLETIISDIRAGIRVSLSEVAGSSVSVQVDGAEVVLPAPSVEIRPKISSKVRWEAVTKVECGRPLKEVADSLGVKPEEIRGWYDDLKKAALTLWGSEN